MTEPRAAPLLDRLRVQLAWYAKLAAFTRGLRTGPARELGQAFPEIAPELRRFFAAEIDSHETASWVLRRELILWGDAWLTRACRVEGGAILDRLRAEGRPVVALAWHFGLAGYAPIALAKHGLRGLYVRFHSDHRRLITGFESVATKRGAQPRARAFAKMIAALQRKETVFVIGGTLAYPLPEAQRVPFFGRSVGIHPGASAMARLARAVIVPIEARLQSDHMAVKVFEPLHTGPTDLDTTRTIAAFFEQRIEADHGQLWRKELERLAATSALGAARTT